MGSSARDDQLPQRFYDALAEPNPLLKNPLSMLGGWAFAQGDPRPTPERQRAFGALMMRGDPDADAWAACESADSRTEWYRVFDSALRDGIDSVPEAPTELKRLLAEAGREPDWLDRSLLRHGADVVRRVGRVGGLVMTNLALLGGYSSGPIAKPLVFTGALTQGTSRRLVETSNFVIDVTRPGGLDPGAQGVLTALRVRMMHGLIRKRIESTPGWRSDLWGVPINQADMIVTNLAFSYVFVIGHRALGYRFNTTDVEALLHLWRYVGYLMGIDHTQLPSTEADAVRTLYLALTLQAPPDDQSRQLANAVVTMPTGVYGDSAIGKLRGRIQQHINMGYARLILGTEASRALGVPTTPWLVWPLLVAPGNFAFETIRQRIPVLNRLAVEVGGFLQDRHNRALLDGREAAYIPSVDVRAPSAV